VSPAEPKVVAFGGGHGLYATLSAIRRFTSQVTAVVTVADDGGSSGRLRAELDQIPPGDLRMALAALAGEAPDDRLWTRLAQHRFGGSGALAGHSVGNLVLAGLTEVLGDPVAALGAFGQVLGVTGTVLPMTTTPLTITAEVTGLEADPAARRTIRGQVAVATTPGQVECVALDPPAPPATPAVLDAIAGADLIVLGPGSWFTSVIPHLLVPDLVAALRASPARTALVLNLVPEPGETAGFSAARHLQVLAEHAPGFRVDTVVIDTDAVPPSGERTDLAAAAALLGARPEYARVAEPGAPRHDPAALAATLAELSGTDASADRLPSGTQVG